MSIQIKLAGTIILVCTITLFLLGVFTYSTAITSLSADVKEYTQSREKILSTRNNRYYLDYHKLSL